MSTTPLSPDDATWGRVEIRVRGHLEARWSDWLEGLTLTRQSDGTTVIEGPVVDQAALFGVISRLRDLALPLISIVHLDPVTATHATADHPPTATHSTINPSRPRSQP